MPSNMQLGEENFGIDDRNSQRLGYEDDAEFSDWAKYFTEDLFAQTSLFSLTVPAQHGHNAQDGSRKRCSST